MNDENRREFSQSDLNSPVTIPCGTEKLCICLSFDSMKTYQSMQVYSSTDVRSLTCNKAHYVCLDFPSAENFDQNSSQGTFFFSRRNWCKSLVNFVLLEKENCYLSANTESALCHGTCTQIVPTCLSSVVLNSPELFFWAISTVCHKILLIFTRHFNFLLGKNEKWGKEVFGQT